MQAASPLVSEVVVSPELDDGSVVVPSVLGAVVLLTVSPEAVEPAVDPVVEPVVEPAVELAVEVSVAFADVASSSEGLQAMSVRHMAAVIVDFIVSS